MNYCNTTTVRWSSRQLTWYPFVFVCDFVVSGPGSFCAKENTTCWKSRTILMTDAPHLPSSDGRASDGQVPARQQPTDTNASIEPRTTSAALAVVLPFVSRHRHPTSCWFVRHRSSPHRQFDVCSPVGQLALKLEVRQQ